MTASWAFALVCGALGVLVPWLIRQLPEPDSRAAQNYSGPSLQAVGSGRWLWLATALSAASVGGLLGAQLGWIPDLGWLAAVVPGGVALAWLDHRTRLLPRRLVFGLYAIVLLGMAAAALDAGSWVAVTRAALGWLALGGWYFLFWRLGGLVGYGDVRLAGLLGLVLGHVGWAAVVVCWLAGPVVAVILSLLQWRPGRSWLGRKIPFGPAMLIGAVVGLAFGNPMWA